MATLTQGSLSLSIVQLGHDAHTLDMGLGLFCDGIPLLAPLLTNPEPEVPTGHVLVEGSHAEETWISSCLRPVLTERWPQFWRNDAEEMGGGIIVYPASFYYVLHPTRNIPWNEVLPSIGKAATVHFRHSIDHRIGDPPFDPESLGLDDDGSNLTVHVHVGARLLGRKGGDVGYHLSVSPKQFSAFLDELDRERRIVLAEPPRG